MRCVFIIAALVGLSGCRCQQPLVAPVGPSELTAEPAALTFQATFLGQVRSLTLVVSNTGGANAHVEVSAADPFSTDVRQLTLTRGESDSIVVTFSPVAIGAAAAVLRVGALEVPLPGDGLEVPTCSATYVCRTSSFDVERAQCLEGDLDDGAPCATRCVTGACASGVCRGQLIDCDDGNACTIDACADDDGACAHQPVTCPAPPSACAVARCDAEAGCGFDAAPDGVLCGADDCSAVDVDVCIGGQCVRRPRPSSGRCANRWVPLNVPRQAWPAMAYDEAQQRVVSYDGFLQDTWAWDGTRWTQRVPATNPGRASGHVMASDVARRKVVLYGGTQTRETWEWDGVTWAVRRPAVSPASNSGHAMAYDAARRRVLLFGGIAQRGLDETWEWDGALWVLRQPPTRPPAREAAALTFDSARGRAVLFGGRRANTSAGAELDDTWEWDGTTWTLQRPATSPSARAFAAMAYDEARSRAVLFGGTAGATRITETWEWDGSTWVQRSPATSPTACEGALSTYDSARQRVVLWCSRGPSTGGSETWEWDGATWVEPAPRPSPVGRVVTVDDPVRQRVVAAMGAPARPGDTWEWNGTTWAARSPGAGPLARSLSAVAYDAVRRRVVLFAGSDGTTTLDDTWEWDGATWVRAQPATSPPARVAHAMAFDHLRQRVVLFGGLDSGATTRTRLADTWEWDGARWDQRFPGSAPRARNDHGMTYDSARQRVVLFGGIADIGGSGRMNDTWAWDGTSWVRFTPNTAPEPRNNAGLAYDSARQRVTLFGGQGDRRFFTDTWEWDGADWTKLAPVTSPPTMLWPTLVYDSGRQRLTLFDSDTTWVFLP